MKNLKTILTLLIGAVIGFSFCQLFTETVLTMRLHLQLLE